MVINSLHEEMFKKEVWEKYGYRKIKKCFRWGDLPGFGLLWSPGAGKDRGADLVLIHDGVRPLVDDKY